MLSISSTWCVEMTTVVGVSLRCSASTASVSSRMIGSSPSVGSSSSTSGGRCARARMRCTRRDCPWRGRSPCDRVRPRTVPPAATRTWHPRPGSSAHGAPTAAPPASTRIPSRGAQARSPRWRGRAGRRLRRRGRTPTPTRRRRGRGRAARGASCSCRRRLGPTSRYTAPSGTWRSRASSAVSRPNRLLRPWVATAMGPSASLVGSGFIIGSPIRWIWWQPSEWP